jgi:hypothetical protein
MNASIWIKLDVKSRFGGTIRLRRTVGQKMVIYKQFWNNRETGVIPVRTRRCDRGQNPRILLSVIGNSLLVNWHLIMK